MASTTRASLLRFELQMAEQAERFGRNLARFRAEKGWKARELVDEMHKLGDKAMSPNQLSRYENGKIYPNETRLGRFAKALDVTTADLICEPQVEEQPDPAEEPTQISELERRSTLNEVLSELAQVKVALAEQRSMIETVLRNQEAGNWPPSSLRLVRRPGSRRPLDSSAWASPRAVAMLGFRPPNPRPKRQ